MNLYFQKSINNPVISRIKNTTNTFCCLSPNTCEASLKRLDIDVCFTLDTFEISIPTFIKTESIDSLGFRINLWMKQQLRLDTNLSTVNRDYHILYCVETSGTTGEPKLVQVPIECIRQNIQNLR
jgi:hypothetical protein